MFKRGYRHFTILIVTAQRTVTITAGMAVKRFAVEQKINMFDFYRREQLVHLRFELLKRGGHQAAIQHRRHRLYAILNLNLNAVVKAQRRADQRDKNRQAGEQRNKC